MIYIVNSEDKINWRAKGNKRIAQNVQNLLCTIKNEVGYAREKGRSSRLIDLDIEEFKNDIVAETYEVVEEYEPRAEILEVNVKGINSDGVNIEVVIEIE